MSSVNDSDVIAEDAGMRASTASTHTRLYGSLFAADCGDICAALDLVAVLKNGVATAAAAAPAAEKDECCARDGLADADACGLKNAGAEVLERAMEWCETVKTFSPTPPSVQALGASLAEVYTASPLAANTPVHANFQGARYICDETVVGMSLIQSVYGKRLLCAMGGCGRSAKVCDPIGCIVARWLPGKALSPDFALAEKLFRRMTAMHV
ncbi:hypothetical protein CGC20_23005 [Leishmania donovani]|uniref:Uncharacterized protein n=2 Tax=Leishmania donovani species complex TaxID=38574 RepID=A0A504Y245_LEIDO|nr:hypothetical protein CGC20_23005 [Leishmania donovani]